MNFYNPGFNFPYSSMIPSRGGIFSRLLGGLKGANWGSIIGNIQKTLGLVNQAIPVVKQINPMIKNAKTMFKVMSELNKTDVKKENTTETKKEEANSTDTKKTAQDQTTTQAVPTVKDDKPSETSNTLNTSDNMGGPTFFL